MSDLTSVLGATPLLDANGTRFGDFWGNQHGLEEGEHLQHIVFVKTKIEDPQPRAGSLMITTHEDVPNLSRTHDSISVFLTWDEIEGLVQVLDEALLDRLDKKFREEYGQA